MIRNLNDLYDKIFYWCDYTGHLHEPGFSDSESPILDKLPPKVREIYDKFWTNPRDVDECIVTANGKTGLLLRWSFPYDYLEELQIIVGGNAPIQSDEYRDAVYSAANLLADNCPYAVLFGEDAQLDRYEINLFIEYNDLMKPETQMWLDVTANRIGIRLRSQVKEILTTPAPESEAKMFHPRVKTLPAWLYEKIYEKFAQELNDVISEHYNFVNSLHSWPPENIDARIAKRKYNAYLEKFGN